jgi:hypothetical protein
MGELRRTGLLTLDDVRDLISQGTPFEVRYDLVRSGDDGQPRYHCIYVVNEGAETVHYTLVRYKPGPYGAEPRTFNLWPALLRHHREYGGGTDLRVSPDTWSISAIPREGAAKPKRRRKA